MGAPNSQTVEALWDAYNFLKELQDTTGDQHWGAGPLIERLRLAAVAAQSNGPSEGACAKALREHNDGCDGACEGRRPTAKDDSGGCGYQRSDGSLIYSRRCPECPKDWKIEVPSSEAGAER